MKYYCCNCYPCILYDHQWVKWNQSVDQYSLKPRLGSTWRLDALSLTTTVRIMFWPGGQSHLKESTPRLHLPWYIWTCLCLIQTQICCWWPNYKCKRIVKSEFNSHCIYTGVCVCGPGTEMAIIFWCLVESVSDGLMVSFALQLIPQWMPMLQYSMCDPLSIYLAFTANIEFTLCGFKVQWLHFGFFICC